jgi:hypothetical protein
MKITSELSVRAIKHGIFITRYTTKTNLVRAIQREEGNYPCFRTDEREYCQGTCEWASGCIDFLIAAWKR